MLGFFRRFTQSKLGVFVTFGFLLLIALAFAMGDITGVGGGIGGMSPATAAEVGNQKITEKELVERTKSALRAIQQQQPTADMAGFIQADGPERVLEQLIDSRAAAMFAEQSGMVVSRRAVDGVIASIPAFRGPDGKFSPNAYNQALASQRITDADVRADIVRERLIQFLTAPANGAARVSRQYALPYASLSLERRKGTVGFIPVSALAGQAPATDAEVTAFYRQNVARYTVPERRVIRYALVTPADLAAQATPTDADLQAAFNQEAARFAASEKRSAQVVVVLDQATANRLAQQARGGTPLDAAARALGLEARTLTGLDRAAVTAQTSGALAEALFAAAPNGVVGPVRGGGGFTIAKLTKVERTPAKTFEQARAELLPEVTKQKQAARGAALNDALDTAAAEGATFDEMVRQQKLTAQKTAPVMQNGMNPLDLKAAPDATLAPVIQAGFAAEQGDAPQIVPVGTDGGFAVVALESIVAAAPRPLAEIRADVARAVEQRRALAAARKIAQDVAAKVQRGMALATALQQTGLKLPPARPIDVPRSAVASNPRGPEPALALMFSMAAGSAKTLEAADGSGWGIVHLATIVPGDARTNPQVVAGAQGELNRSTGVELVEQFGRAIRDRIGAKRNPAGLERAKRELSGQSPDAQP